MQVPPPQSLANTRPLEKYFQTDHDLSNVNTVDKIPQPCKGGKLYGFTAAFTAAPTMDSTRPTALVAVLS